ncbi:hypothetical protein ACFWP5_17340 [Streptomyces sp. NPDC058469]|uniref:hypothetical protein n=1 Tax=Streptomyces sp. NPDC058469 TaxID=3346514 RepID=UPI003666B1C4
MRNFSDAHLPVVDGVITVPTGGRTEDFVDAADIAAVAVQTLLDPEAHAGGRYAPTGPRALTVAEVADTITAVTGRPVRHQDIDPEAWIGGAVAAGVVPADYAVMLRRLTGSIVSGDGSTPKDDIEKVTGRPPTAFHDFARRNAGAWVSPGGSEVTMSVPAEEMGEFAALDPFFRIVQEGLAGLVDGGHFFDLLAEDVVVEYVLSVPGYPRRVEGRGAVADLHRGYGDVMLLHSADGLAVHRDPQSSVAVLEYAVHGRAVRTGRAYDNHFVSVLTVRDRKVTHWRDYLDPVAVFRATGWPAEGR